MKHPWMHLLAVQADLREIERAAFRFVSKFHHETACGDVFHWAECERLVGAFGFDSWDEWREHESLVLEAEAMLPESRAEREDTSAHQENR